VEWVVTAGRSVEEAKDAALDELGVDEDDAEFEILEEPRPGLFGRIRGEARVRARIRPTVPRPKVERRDKRRRSGSSGGGGGRSRGRGKTATSEAPEASPDGEAAPEPSAPQAERPSGGAPGRGGRGRRGGPSTSRPAADQAESGESPATSPEAPAPPAPPTDPTDAPVASTPSPGDPAMSDTTLTLDEQSTIVVEFLDGLLEAFGAEGQITVERIDDENAEIRVDGDDLGLLIGPKGNTLSAVQELSRTVVQRRAAHAEGRVRIDIGGYRQRRREALERFTRQVAEDVKTSGVQKALEPMHPADRKVVHDVANTIDGVRTLSEGEEPRRRVVIIPE
jgi:spoIIIJ-associated protein